MNPSISYLTIDISANNNFDYVKAVQGDNKTRYIHITLLDNNVPYTLKTGLNAVVRGTKSDNTEIFNSCSISSDGKIIVEITEQMVASAGIGQYEIALYKDDTNECLTSFPFKLYVSPASFNAGTVVSSDEFTQLTNSISIIQDITSDATTAIQNMNELKENVENAEAIRISNETERVSNENTRKSAENTRISNENTRKTNETNRVNAEKSRVTAETNRANAETARDTNEQTRIANENARKSAETSRETEEAKRVSNENTRKTNETNRANAENTRITDENTRKSNETGRINAENTRVSNENTRKTNETKRIENESLRQTNTSTAITNAETATERANKAAKACEDIVVGQGIVMTTEKGSPNGVAKLDSNAIIVRNQLPVYEVVSNAEPSGQIVNDFWLQEY